MIHPMFYILIALSIPVTLINCLSLVLHFRRSNSTSRYGMLLTLLLTYLLYGIFTFLCYIWWLVPHDFYLMALIMNYSILKIYEFTPFVSQMMVTFCSTIIALDRVLLMAAPMSYAFRNVSIRLSYVVGVLNTLMVLFFLVASLTAGESESFRYFLGKLQRTLEFNILPGALLLELVFYLIFMVKFRIYTSNPNNHSSKKQTAETNHIVIFQMVCHTLLCFIPNAVRSLHLHGVPMSWYSQVDDYTGVMFAAEVHDRQGDLSSDDDVS